MHGVIVSNFKRYLDEFIGRDAWGEVVNGAGLQGHTYLPVALYPDEEMEALLRAAEGITGLRRDDLLVDFGEWVIGPMLKLYQGMVPAEGGTVALMLNLQQVHMRILQLKDKSAKAPNMVVYQRADDTVEVRYYSLRNMAAMVRGAVKGVAAYYNETATLLASEIGEGGESRFVFQVKANSDALSAKQAG